MLFDRIWVEQFNIAKEPSIDETAIDWNQFTFFAILEQCYLFEN
jgi:hypothetical protein